MADINASKTAAILSARVLGQVSFRVGERVLADDAWPPRGGRDLLLLLLATPDHRLPREHIYEALWPALPPDAARNAFYKAVHSLRRTLEPGLPSRAPGSFVISRAGVVALAPGAVRVDLDAFIAALARVEDAPPRQQIAALDAALALYPGDLLAGEPAHEWSVRRRETVRQTWQRAVMQLAARLLESGDPRGVIGPLESIVAADPVNEEAQRLLIGAYERSGQRDRAQRQYAGCVAALRDELGVDPSPETLRLGADLQEPLLPARTARSSGERARSNLPMPPSALIGRDEEVTELVELLSQPAARMITLIGPGGIGKTRLVLDVAWEMANTAVQDVVFVSLAPIPEATLAPQAMLRSLGVVQDQRNTPLGQLCQVLRDRNILIVLDNFEHILDAAPALADVLATCPGVTVLVTSREPLRLRAERLFDVGPLEAPDLGGGDRRRSVAVLQQTAAVALFIERAAAIVPGFRLNDANVSDVAGICARLEGLPLAIELAAARSREFSPDRFLALLENRLDTLVAGYRDLPPRQQTIRDTIAWSHDLLPADLQVLFRRLAVFSGGCPVATAADLAGLSEEQVAAEMQALVEKSLLRWHTESVEARADMLEVTREFARERLAGAGETEFALDFLVDWAVALTAAAANHLSGPVQGSWLDRLDRERDNLRSALAWTIAQGDGSRALALAGNLWRYWWRRTAPTEGREWLERALALPGTHDLRLRGATLNGAASLVESQGDFARAVALHAEVLAIWRRLGNLTGEARALTGLGAAATHQGGEDDPGAATVDDEMVLVPQPCAAFPRQHRCGVGIGGANAEIGRASVSRARFVAVGPTGDPKPGVALRSTVGELGECFVCQVDWQPHRLFASCPVRLGSLVIAIAVVCLREEVSEVRLDGEAALQRVEGGVGGDLGGVEIEFLAPDQPGREALLDDLLEEATEDLQPVALPDATETGVVGKWLGQIIAEIPARAEPVGHHLHQLPLRAESLKEEDQLQLEEDDWVDAGAPTLGIGVTNQITHEAQIECALQLAIEVMGRDEGLLVSGGNGLNARSLRPIATPHPPASPNAAARRAAGPCAPDPGRALSVTRDRRSPPAPHRHRDPGIFNTLPRSCDSVSRGGVRPAEQEPMLSERCPHASSPAGDHDHRPVTMACWSMGRVTP